jgi:hypothetical protein
MRIEAAQPSLPAAPGKGRMDGGKKLKAELNSLLADIYLLKCILYNKSSYYNKDSDNFY